jgi:hypothetical protein
VVGLNKLDPKATKPIRRIRDYYRFFQQHQQELGLFEDAGITSPSERIEDWHFFRLMSAANEAYRQELRIAGKKLPRRSKHLKTEFIGSILPRQFVKLLPELAKAYAAMPPSFPDFLMYLELQTLFDTVTRNKATAADFETFFAPPYELAIAHLARYIMGIILTTHVNDAALCTWSPQLQKLTGAVRAAYLGSSDEDVLSRRRSVEEALRHEIIKRHLPRVDDLPAEEILFIREKRAAELDEFRFASAALATNIDVTKTPHEVALQVRDIVTNTVDRALIQLQKAVRTSRYDALLKVGRAWKTIAAATIPVAVSAAVGGSLEVSALVSLLAGGGTFVAEQHLQRQKLYASNEWAMLLSLKRAQRAKGA